MKTSLNIAVFASGKGSNFQSLVDYFKKSNLVKIKCLICDNIDAKANDIAKASNIPIYNAISKKFKTKLEPEIENEVCKYLITQNIDLIVLAGYMRVIKNDLLDQFENKIINIHPSLLPSFKGLNAVKQAIDTGVKISGCTIHFVDKEIDNGKIIAQSCVSILDKGTVESLHNKIHAEEHKLYPATIEKVVINILKKSKGI